MLPDYEKLGVFYMGKEYDLAKKTLLDHQILYDSKDLVTHAVCVGMTGSGKTGLCISLLEEAAIDSIPAIIIDPKGDLSNLLLTFPKLRGQDFEPWINLDDARKKGLKPAEFAQQQADLWKKGLAEWNEDGDRIQRLRDAADFAIYTPGSNAGIPVSILQSFKTPEESILSDNELFRERVATTATCVLTLLNIDADPMQSPEHILISSILSYCWKKGEDLDIATLIHHIQSPPMSKIGVMDLESFLPGKKRFALAMQLNNLIASPGFEAWMEGVPLDIGNLLHSQAGKPRMAIFSISHLADTERMFFVSLLLNQVLGWMRSQPGTTSLRALVYMDEIFGYFPPVANPPSKTPLLTLLKQARAFGVGLVLATQNPVDLDYKGLSNTGTWFIGRLQTERDKNRVLDGLEGAAADASAKFDRTKMEKILAGLGKRVFLLHNVNEDAPVVFQTRWALSYLRGPMTRQQIKSLMDGVKAEAPAAEDEDDAPAKESSIAAEEQRPLLPPEIPQFFAPIRGRKPDGAKLIYEPKLLACAQVYWTDTKNDIDMSQNLSVITTVTEDAVAVDWEHAEDCELSDGDLEKGPAEETALFAHVARDAAKPKSYDAWKKGFVDFLFRNRKLEIFKSPGLGVASNPGETERDFRIRLQQAAREERDARKEELRVKYSRELQKLEEDKRKKSQAVEKKNEAAKQSRLSALLNIGATVLGAFLGKGRISATTVNKGVTATKSAGKILKDSTDVRQAEENVEVIQKKIDDLNERFKQEVEELEAKIDPAKEELTSVSIKPKKMNITPRLCALVWLPSWQFDTGIRAAAWE